MTPLVSFLETFLFWIEIQRLYTRIDILESILREFGINIPDKTFEELSL